MTATRYTGGGGGSGGGPNPSDAFSLGIKFAETNAAPTDTATFGLGLAAADTNAAPTDALTLNIQGLGDTNTAPTDTKSALVRYWLTGSTGTSNVTNPTAEDGSNNGAVATVTTVPAGATTATLTGLVGTSIAAGTAFTSAIFRGWFKSVNVLATSTTTIKAHSSSALFADVTLFSNSAAATTVDNLAGAFTFDLVAAGINTLAKLQSVQIVSSTTDVAAGVSPAVLTVDAASIDLTGVF